MTQRFEYIVTLGFVALLCAPVVLDVSTFDCSGSLPGIRREAEISPIRPGEWLDGAATDKIERKLAGNSLLTRWLVPHYNAAFYRMTGRTAPAARIGEGGWVFASRRTRPLPGWRYDRLLRLVPRRLRAQVDEVEKSGVRVVLAVVPDRSRTHPERAYPSGRIPSGKRDYLPRLLTALGQANLPVVDLRPAMRRVIDVGNPPFYRADHHWTSHGAQAAAEDLAAALRSQELVPTCTHPGFRAHEITWFDEVEEISLVRKLGFPRDGAFERSYRDRYQRARISKRGTWHAREATIAYVTTSYGRWGAPEMLANLLHCPVAHAARDGNSFTVEASLAERMRKVADPARVRLVIWELNEYDLYAAPGVPLGLHDD